MLLGIVSSCPQVVNICVWVLASAFGVPAMVMGNVEEEQEHNSKSFTRTHRVYALYILYAAGMNELMFAHETSS